MLVATFYSFKGGVGRTMLATNVAGLLADAGQRVLLVDFDLEAPGLSYLPELRPKDGPMYARGVVGFLADSWRARKSQDVLRYLYDLEGFQGRLSIMPAGNVTTAAFAEDFHALGNDFFRTAARDTAGLTLFYDLRKQWERDFDYVLIDSRTGFTDVGGVCTRLLPDLLVAVLSLNRQGRSGMAQVLRQVGDRSLYGFPVETLVVASMVPTDWPEQIKPEMESLAQELDKPENEIRRLPLRDELLIREQPFYYRAEATPPDDQLRINYVSVSEAIRDRNEWDIEFKLNRARAAMTAGEAEPAERLVASLLTPSEPVPTRRLLRILHDGATMLLQASGSPHDVERRQRLAIGALRGALPLASSFPLEHGAILNSLANALVNLPGAEEFRSANLREAITHYRAALMTRPSNRFPSQHAGALNNLALALRKLPDQDSGATHLGEAIGLYREALALLPRTQFPVERAMTLNNLAQALAELSSTKVGSAANLREAIDLYRAALDIYTPDEFPVDHAMVLNNLGNALQQLSGSAADPTTHLAEAIALYRTALNIRTRDRFPVDYALTLRNLAVALCKLPGDETRRAANLRQAIEYYRAVLDVFGPDRYPTERQRTIKKLADMLATAADLGILVDAASLPSELRKRAETPNQEQTASVRSGRRGR